MAREIKYEIYMATNLLNGHFYIGKTKYGVVWRSKRHLEEREKKPSYFHNALIKYGFDNFEWKVIDTAETEKELDEKEMHWIAFYKSNVKGIGYNMTKGGDGFRGKHRKETLEKMSRNLKGHNVPDEARVKIRESKLGEKNPMYGKYGIEHHRSTPVKAIDKLGNVFYFGSTMEAQKETKVPNSNICKVLKGERKTAGGYQWFYITKKEYLEAIQLSEAI